MDLPKTERGNRRGYGDCFELHIPTSSVMTRSLISILALLGQASSSICQDTCPLLSYASRQFEAMDSAQVAGHLYPCESVSVDSLDCSGALYMAAYAKELGCSDLLFRCVAKLVELGGLLPTSASRASRILGDLFDGSDSAKYWQLVDSLHPKFITANRDRLETMDAIREMWSLDQSRQWIYEFGKRWTTEGTIDPLTTPSGFIEHSIDSLNFSTLLALCSVHGELPLSDRYGWTTTGTVRGILLHAAQDRAFHSTWRSIWPFVIDAMEGCRIGDDFLQMYDHTRYLQFGQQWFGTLKDKPIQPGEEPEFRRMNRRIE